MWFQDNISNEGAFFLEDDKLVLNTAIPHPIAVHDIEYVELKYQRWQLEKSLSYGLSIRVVKKNGKTKRVFYKGYGTAKLAYPSDMAAALEEKGIRCVLAEK